MVTPPTKGPPSRNDASSTPSSPDFYVDDVLLQLSGCTFRSKTQQQRQSQRVTTS
jgi:hypothetical protein